jgi:MoaA/NifB/PqqE/SkfB family radical SAM enzyme
MGLKSHFQSTILPYHALQHLRTVLLRRTHPYGRIPERPQRVIVEPTNACNLKCSYCGNKDMLRRWTWLEWDVYQRLVGEMRALGVPRLTLHTVGEPTLHPRLPQMVALAKSAGLTVTLSTNGTLLSEERARALVEAGPDILSLSVDVADPEKMKVLRPGIDPAELYAGLQRLRRLRDERGPEQESPWGRVRLPSLVATCVVTRFWTREEERAWFERYGPLIDDVYIHWPNAHAGYREDEPHRRKSLLPKKLKDWIYRKARYSCPYPWDALFLLSDGTMSVCRFDFDARVHIGRYPDQDLKQLWHGQRMMSLRKAHMDFDFRDWSTCEDCNATFYENRHDHFRYTQKLKRRNGFVARRDMWLAPEPMSERARKGVGRAASYDG